MLLPSAKHSETNFPKESLPGSCSCGTPGSLIIHPILRQVFKIGPWHHESQELSVSDTASGVSGCFPCNKTEDKMPPLSLQLLGPSGTQHDGDGHCGGEQRAASAVTAHLQLSHCIYHGPFPVADIWDPNLVALGLMTVLLHQKAGAHRSFSNTQTLHAPSCHPGSGIPPGDTMSPFPSCSTGPKSSATGRKEATISTPALCRTCSAFLWCVF